MTSVLIEGDRNIFVSKSAIDRFKNDVKTTKPDMIDSSKYLKEGYSFKITQDNNNFTVKIISTQEELLENKRAELRNKLRRAQRNRTGEQFKELGSMKRTIPDKLFKSYMNLVKNYNLPNIPSPIDVINNTQHYKNQISTIMGTLGSVSIDSNMNNAIKNYFNTLGKFMGIEPMNFNLESEPVESNTMQRVEQRVAQQVDNSDTEDEDDIPTLVKS